MSTSQSSQLPKFYSVPEVAQLTGLSESNINKQCRAGIIGTKIGRNYAILKSELKNVVKRPPGRPRAD